MNHLILLMSGSGGPDHPLHRALINAAPDCRVESVWNCEQIAGFHQPALILLDLQHSYEPALEVLRWLRAEKRYRNVPVFVLGSDAGDLSVNQAYALGANSCLVVKSEPDSLEPIARGIGIYASLMPLQTN
jgi:CheY-like chemotaxis protein